MTRDEDDIIFLRTMIVCAATGFAIFSILVYGWVGIALWISVFSMLTIIFHKIKKYAQLLKDEMPL